MNIGFDLDKIFINFPPLIPAKIIELLNKEKGDLSLKYRIPSKLEQNIRILSHSPILRSPIIKNLSYIKDPNLVKNNKYYLISGRFDFLKKRTDNFIKKYRLNNVFRAMYFNYKNEQPHQFKDQIIKKLKLDIFVDDDLQLLEYLNGNNPKTNFFWLNGKISKILKNNLFAIRHLSEMFTRSAGFK
jgi:hypothetical protein